MLTFSNNCIVLLGFNSHGHCKGHMATFPELTGGDRPQVYPPFIISGP